MCAAAYYVGAGDRTQGLMLVQCARTSRTDISPALSIFIGRNKVIVGAPWFNGVSGI